MRACLFIAAAILAGCDAPPAARLQPPDADAAAPDPALRAQAGVRFSNFVTQAGARYAPEAMGFSAADRARLWRNMAISAPAELISGGGGEALVFRGCAAEGCAAGFAIVAVDTGTGGAFFGVKDAGGADILALDERALALLQTNARQRTWDETPTLPAPEANP